MGVPPQGSRWRGEPEAGQKKLPKKGGSPGRRGGSIPRLGFLARGDIRGQGFRLTQANSRGEGRVSGAGPSARRGCGRVIRDVNSDQQQLVAPDDRRQVAFAARVFEEADTPRFEDALAAVARADGRRACHHEHPLPTGTAMPATHPVWREAEEPPLRGPGRRGNIEGRCRRGKLLVRHRHGRRFEVRLAGFV